MLREQMADMLDVLADQQGQWQISFVVPSKGSRVLTVRCTNTSGETQDATPIWNPEGFMLNDIERTPVVAT